MSVATLTPRQKELQEPRKLCHALIGGTKAMIEADRDFTPQHEEELYADYLNRLKGTTLYNGFKETVTKQTGKIFSRDIVINEDVPSEISDLLKNIDGQGRSLSIFAYDSFFEAMIDGINFIYVDFPPIQNNSGGFATRLDQQQQGARPSAIIINADNILGIKHANILGVEQLTEVRIKESISIADPKDPYIEKTIDQIRVLYRGSYELWRKDPKAVGGGLSNDNWVLFEDGPVALDYIPLVPVYTNRVGYMEGYPPLRPLAELNQEHWISSSEQRHALTFARFAMMVFTGVDQADKIGKASPNTAYQLANERATVHSITTAGEGIAQGFADIKGIEERMKQTGLAIRVMGADGMQTATEATINSEDSNSALLAAAYCLENSLNNVLDIFADYMGLPSGGTVTVSKLFGQKKPAGAFNEIISMRVTGDLSREGLLEESKRRGVLSEDFDIKQELQRTNDEGMSLMQSVNPNQPITQQMGDGNHNML